MKPTKFILLWISGILLAFSCTTLKRHASAVAAGRDNTLADIDMFGFRLLQPVPENGNKSLWDLSADAQAQFIRILNSRYPDNEKFLQAMSYTYLSEENPVLPVDYVTKDLRMVFSVSKRRDYSINESQSRSVLSPADRIEYLKITLSIPPDAGVRFKEWNMYSTEYGSVSIADVSFSNSFDLDASGIVMNERKEISGEIKAGGKSSVSRREDQELKFRYIKLNGKLKNNQVEMEEEGTREIDLAGNITADLTLEFDRFPEIITSFTGLKDSLGSYNEPGNLALLNSDAVIPRMENVQDTLFADLRLDYIFRNVLKGEKTFQEWDDRVKYYNGSVSRKVMLFTSADYVPDFYCIGNNLDNNQRDIVHISSPYGKEYKLIFRSYEEAMEFHEWLGNFFACQDNHDKTVNIGGFLLKFRDSTLNNRVFPGLTVVPCYRY